MEKEVWWSWHGSELNRRGSVVVGVWVRAAWSRECGGHDMGQSHMEDGVWLSGYGSEPHGGGSVVAKAWVRAALPDDVANISPLKASY